MNSTSSVSFEFFPPNTPVGTEKLKTVVQELGAARPEFFSVTFGAGGSTREKTFSTVTQILTAGYDAAPHFSCIGATRQNVLDTLAGYKAAGIKRLVALRGDLPSGMAGTSGDFNYADELVRFVRETQGEAFHIEVAAYPEVHPQSRSAAKDLDAFCGKLEAGAHSAITQFFFNADAYFYFRDQVRARGLTQPIVPGVMPILSFSKIVAFCERDGIDMPRWIARKMESFGDDDLSIEAFGLDVVSAMTERLVRGGAPSVHLYTMNQSRLSLEVCRRMGWL